MNTVSIVGSVSRRAGGLFESVRRLHWELLAQNHKEGVCRAKVSNGRLTIRVLSLVDEFTGSDASAWEPVSVEAFEPSRPRALRYAPQLLPRLLDLHPDLVHVHGVWQFNSLAALAWHRQTRRPYLVSPHGMLDPWALRNSRWKKALAWVAYERRHLNSATCLRALCQSEANAIRALGITKPICVLPNGVDVPSAGAVTNGLSANKLSTKLCVDLAGKSLGPPSGLFDQRKVLLYLGRIHPKKGLCNLLKAWAKLQSCERWVLVIAGWDQSGHEGELKCLANDLQIRWSDVPSRQPSESSLLFVGAQFGAAKHAWLSCCDAFILPSFSEGVPMAVLEAWAHAKPVLMTPQCNLPEGFVAEAALRIVPEPEAIASELCSLFALSNSEREAMGLRGRVLVSSRFAWPHIAAELRSVYYWMTGSGPKPACLVTE